MPVEVKSSVEVKTRHLKQMFYGPTGSRKTETVLRNFPHVLVIDTEGNAEQCVGMAEIPEFLLAQTKDPLEVIALIDQVAAGKLKFKDGSPVETISIDSVSILWSVRQEVGSMNAEKRAAKWNKSADEANMTQLDWVLAKRPLKNLNTRLANCPVKYIILIAREKDLYQQKEGGKKDELVRVGVTPDVVKGTDYDMNLIWHLGYSPEGKWQATVDKVQGAFGTKFPKGTTVKAYPTKEVLAYAAHLTAAEGTEQSETEVAKSSVEKETTEAPMTPAPKTPAPAKTEIPAKQPQGQVSNPKQAFLAEVLALGYKKDDKVDLGAMKAQLEPSGLWPFQEGDQYHDMAIAVLKAAKIVDADKADTNLER